MTDLRPAGIPHDTSIEAWKIEMAAVRALTPEQRIEAWAQFQFEIDELALKAIQRRFPDADREFQLAELVRRTHGEALANAAYPNITFQR
ncbi:MAG: hypothetical protein WEA11_06480 [Acidimicrobiales bacterium]